MSWAAHDFEPYVLQKHLKGKVSLLPLYLGSVGPDMVTKWYVYGLNLGFLGLSFGANDPSTFHRGWPGAGFTHSPLFGIFVGLVIYAISRNRIWALSFSLGMLAHAFTDTLDTNGTMLLFPFSTEKFTLGAWAYAAEEGHLADGRAYYSSLGVVSDCVWGLLALSGWQVLKTSYFRENIVTTDPVWRRLGRYLPETPLLVLYRVGFVFGCSRIIAWLIYSHVLNSSAWDLSWGGPYWVTPIR